jgi:hypothetical protein
MNKNSSTALGLTLAIALTTGSVLVKHPPATGNKAPGAHSDITIVQDDSERVVPPPSPDSVPGGATVPPPVGHGSRAREEKHGCFGSQYPRPD